LLDMADRPGNPHDALFRRTFSLASQAAAELRLLLPAPLVARIDWPTLQLRPGSFVDATLASSNSDLLYAVQLSPGRPALLYILFEHQSTVDPLLPLRLLRYVVNVLEQHVRETANQPPLPLPLVVPVVLHHSATGWTTGRTVQALFDPGCPPSGGAPLGLSLYFPDWIIGRTASSHRSPRGSTSRGNHVDCSRRMESRRRGQRTR
jgi:hypothetical protein